MTSPSTPSSCSGLRTSTTSAPSRRSTAACSRNAPWTARTPILTRAILGGGLPRPVARRQAEHHEEEADDAEDERQNPHANPFRLPQLLRREHREGGDVRPLHGEVRSR